MNANPSFNPTKASTIHAAFTALIALASMLFVVFAR